MTAAAGRVVPADSVGIARAAELLRAGGLVAFPTETVYGLGANATDDAAVARIFAAKERPQFNPLIVHVGRAGDAAALVGITPLAKRLSERFWPGPLTMVLPRHPDSRLSLLVSAGLDSVALRVPASAVAQELLRAAAVPVAAPSANRSGTVSPTTAAHVAESLGERVDLIVDGGACAVGLESTIVDLTAARPRLLRPGGVPREDIESVTGPLEKADEGARPRAPGMLASHYAPSLPLRLEAMDVTADEALLAFGPNPPTGAAATLNLSTAGALAEAAANLFAMLRALDRPEFAAIAVMPVPDRGLGAAINDRLRRAAAPRN